MSIQVQCPGCQKTLKAPDTFAGKTARCPNCKQQVTVPAATVFEEELGYCLRDATLPASTSSAPSKTAPPVSASRSDAPESTSPQPPRIKSAAGIRQPSVSTAESPHSTTLGQGLYWLFALMLIPLAISIFHGQDRIVERMEQTLQAHPEIKSRIERDDQNFSDEDFFALLPDGKIEGAHLPHNTWVHWFYAMASTALFGIAFYSLFPPGNAHWKQTALIGVCTATFGIVFLIAMQWIAEITQGFVVFHGGIIMVLFYIVAFIGYSYRAALDPNSGFLLSMLGFTFGVGLCEELTKALPVVFHFRSKATLDWRGACLWGLASGAGFGIAEGIMYSSDYYNGLADAEAYIVRFISCVAMQAIWTASAAIMIWRRRSWFQNDWEWGDFIVTLLWVLAVPMTLHGLYDTLLKRDMEVYALLTAAASFAWLVFVTEWTRSTDKVK